MVNIFSLILVIITLITGLLWSLDKFVISTKRYEFQDATQKEVTVNQIDEKTIKKNLPKFNKCLKTGSSIFPVIAIVLIVRSFIYEPFQISSSSMMPTLLIGDFILVEKFAYGIKDPIYQRTLIKTSQPKRGDIVVFKYPEDPRLIYIKRAVGLPGDKVTYNLISKEVMIHPDCGSGITCKNILPIRYSNVEASDFVQIYPHRNHSKIISNAFQIQKSEIKENSTYFIERKETIGNVTHSILTIPIAQNQLRIYYQNKIGQQLVDWVVPSGQYFMMGDNRDNSSDSRYWGFVPEKNLIGKATLIWMSLEKTEGEWPVGVRLNHIGRIH